jgi:hypothetical protein
MKELLIDIRPGDIGFTKGGGLVGWVICHGTGSTYAHSFVYISKNADGSWNTIEAWPSIKKDKDGTRYRIRTELPSKVVRVWRTKKEQQAIIEKSKQLVGTRYGWGEIMRIILHFLGIKFIPKYDSKKRAICSNVTMQAVLSARSKTKYFFRFEPYQTWPGELADTLDRLSWAQERLSEREVKNERQKEKEK